MIEEYWQFGRRFTQRKSSSKDLCLLPAKAPNWAGCFLYFQNVESFSCLFKMFILHLYLFASRQLWCVEGMAVFATPSWPSQTSGRHPYLVPYPGERWWNYLFKKKSDIERLVVQIFNHLNQVTFDDETPERPPPPPPARVQSINTMKDFSGVSQAYNQVGLQFMFPFLPLMSLLAWKRQRKKTLKAKSDKHLNMLETYCGWTCPSKALWSCEWCKQTSRKGGV